MFAQNRSVSQAALVSALALATFAGTPWAMAQEGNTPQNGAAVTTEAKPLVITCIAASGKVMFKSGPDAALTELKTGQALTESSEVFTSIGAIVQIKIGEGQVFTIDRLSRVLIKNAIAATDGKQTTELQLPYGRVRFDVVSTNVANAVKIESPDATLAVKGTHGVMEKIPGQPTRAYGGELNEGIFNVMLTSGVNADVKKNQLVTSSNIQVADVADARAFVQTEDAGSSDQPKGEARWTPSGGAIKQGDQRKIASKYQKRFFPPIIFPDGTTPINDDVYVGVDRVRGRVITAYDHGTGPSFDVGHYLVGFRGTPQGAALVMTETGPSVVAIDDNAGPGVASGTLALRRWDLNTSKWELLGNLAPLALWDEQQERVRTSAYNLDGLGNLGGTLYASGFNTPLSGMSGTDSTLGHYGIFRLSNTASDGSGFRAQQVMSFPMMQNGGGLTGANSLGTMFAAARWDLNHGTSPGGVVLLEVDPRINFIHNAWSVSEGDLVLSNGNASIPSNFQASGVAFAGGQVVLTGSAGGQSVTAAFDLPNDSRNPNVRLATSRSGVGNGASASNALAGEGGFSTVAAFPIGGVDPKAINVPGVDPLWLSTGYSREAAQSRTLRRMARDTVLSVARNPAACAASPEINNLNRSLLEYYGQRRGVGSALNHFYQGLPANHPCGCNRPLDQGA